jgi:hypothetical protein
MDRIEENYISPDWTKPNLEVDVHSKSGFRWCYNKKSLHYNTKHQNKRPIEEMSAQMTTQGPLHPCVACRHRKVKCDRRQPCSRCLATGDDCLQPEGRRAPRRVQRPRDSALLDRIRQLESSLEEIKPLVLEKKEHGGQGQDGFPDSTRQADPQQPAEAQGSSGLLINDKKQTRYISASSWVSLADKVGPLP